MLARLLKIALWIVLLPLAVLLFRYFGVFMAVIFGVVAWRDGFGVRTRIVDLVPGLTGIAPGIFGLLTFFALTLTWGAWATIVPIAGEDVLAPTSQTTTPSRPPSTSTITR